MKSTKSKITLLSLLFISFSGFSQNALHFDGIDDQVDCGAGTAVSLAGGSITMEAWIKADNWETNVWEGNIINKEQNTGTSAGYMLRVGQGGRLNMNLGDGGWNELTTLNSVLMLNTWHHVAGTYDGTEMKLYVDGVAVDSTNYNITFTGSNVNLLIGAHNNASWNRYFEGSIDEVRIWDVARTQSEIQQNMNELICADATGLKAYYRFDQGTGTNLVDGVGGSDGTLLNFALTGSTSNWVSSAISFSRQFQSFTQNDTICKGETLNFGSQILSAAGTYSDTLLSPLSCDSIVQLNLAVKTINNNIYVSNDTLWAVDSSLSYHWIDCNNQNRTIPNATQQYYVPFVSTVYAVIVTDGECVDTSNCVAFNIGLPENEMNSISVYPNPLQDELSIDINSNGNIVKVTVLGMDGKVFLEKNTEASPTVKINTQSLPKGAYQLIVTNHKNERSYEKVLKL